MDSIRILWLTHRDVDGPLAGGAERSIRELSRRLALKGHEVLVVSGGPRMRTTRSVRDGVRWEKAGRAVVPHVVAFKEAFAFRPDVIIEDLAHVVPWLTSRLHAAPVVAYFRHLHARTLPGQVPPPIAAGLSWIERNYRRLLGRVRVVTESASSFHDLMELGFPQDRIELIPPGVDSELFRPGELSASPELVYFGGLRRYKRPGDVLQLLSRLNDEGIDAHLTVVGNGPALGPLVQAASRLGVAGSVRFAGRLTESDLASNVRRAWVNVHTATSEGWCLSAMEAAASGVPTVAYNVPGVRDSVIEGVTGTLVPDGRLDLLQTVASGVLRSPTHWRLPCREHALAYSWEKTADQWNRLVTSAAHGD